MSVHETMLKLYVNGKPYTLSRLPGETLAELLRGRLGLTGTKIGCNEAECGSCTVLVDGEAVLSCNYPALRAHGKQVLTIEGLAALTPWNNRAATKLVDSKVASLHPIQQAFVLYGAIQCGFCTPGLIMAAYALLAKNPQPIRRDIRQALRGTLCRCGGYSIVEDAILAAAHSLRTRESLLPPQIDLASQPLHTIGRIQIRPDALAKAMGTAIFTDDLVFDGMLIGRVKHAGVPHAILKCVDVQKASKLVGVSAVLTAEDIPGAKYHGLAIEDWPILVGLGERVRYVGDAIALVAAKTDDIAQAALDLIEVEFEQQEVVDNPLRALEPGAPRLYPSGNLLKHIKLRKGDMHKGFAQADLTIEHVYHTQAMDHAFLEPECSIARPLEDDRLEIYVGSQIPYKDRQQVARALGVDEQLVHVNGQLIGGGFGGKEDIAGQIHAALLAQATGCPVKVLFDRRESMLVHPKRHATQIRVKAGVTKDGKLTAVETELFGDTGAYASLGDHVLTRATTHSSGPYEVPNVKSDCYAMYTNNPPAGAFRGFGALQGQFAIENMMDQIAVRLSIDPVELRRRNALRIGSTTSTGQQLDESVGLLECIDKVDQELRRLCKLEGIVDPFEPRSLPRTPHVKKAWGFAAAYKNTGLGGGANDQAEAEIELLPDGTFEARISSAELGQGLVTVLQMIVAEEFSTPCDLVKIRLMDTDLTPDGGPTTASRQTYVSGNAVRYAAKVLRDAICATLAEVYNLPPRQVRFENGLALGNGQKMDLPQVYSYMRQEGREPRARYVYHAPQTQPLGQPGDIHFTYSFAAQAVEVEVNRLTGEVDVLRVIVANDVGKVINPLGLKGQIEGGVIMGIGHALTENFIVEQGRPFTDRLARYRIPDITRTPDIISFIIEHPTADGPYGAKGVGEIVSIPTIPAITNAIYHAVGVRVDHLPVEQEFIWRELNNKTAPFLDIAGVDGEI
jgi:CO/xanthine dehydrogenase Mo-binding subunit/aerobic-type carbon monoxide dehydrogenase small subunit (CoxS/CutS family)